MPATVIRMFVFNRDLGNCAAAQNTEVRKEKIRFTGTMTGVEQGLYVVRRQICANEPIFNC